MNDFAAALRTAVDLILGFDAGLRDIVVLSLAVSLTASACAFVIGAPLGTALAVYRFRGRGALVVVVNALLGLPPVVVGLAVYLLLSRSGPLGSFGILFTPTAMVIAQCALGTPIVIALDASHGGRAVGGLRRCASGRRRRALARHRAADADGAGRIAHGISGGVRPRHRRGRRHHHRRRQYPRLHPHHDDGDRLGNQQGQSQPGAGAGHDFDRAVDGGERREPGLGTRACVSGSQRGAAERTALRR